ncbi:Pentatricopeptide repeat-containing protein [Clarias magur]|uniref:Pentatricopeptide repeat-containing protein n=1 Tax=Clarias magur TaxID=1594786 RepID=A0A8J4XE88_CLAMG|nr:Pentatricopeptide repeat-containing protein [Clarias magur]
MAIRLSSRTTCNFTEEKKKDLSTWRTQKLAFPLGICNTAEPIKVLAQYQIGNLQPSA